MELKGETKNKRKKKKERNIYTFVANGDRRRPG